MYILKAKHICMIVCALAALCSYPLRAQTNLALNKDATASTNSLAAFRAVDGSFGTRWESVHSEPVSWLRVDLGASYELGSTSIHWETANAAVYEVQGSNDDSYWETLATYTGGVIGTRTDTLALSGSYRYLRIYALQKSEGNDWGYSIWEWEVSGSQPGEVLLFENFDNATFPMTSLNIVNNGRGELVTDPMETYGNQGKSFKYTYRAMPEGDLGQNPYGTYHLSTENSYNVYIRFVAKMPEYKHGLKFVKVFGQGDPSSNVANVTFGLDYTGIGDGTGSMYAVSFGDGSTPINDTDNVLKFNGTDLDHAGRSYNMSGFDPGIGQYRNFRAADWGTGWHKFEFYVKFNSGTSPETEVNDGEFLVRIDDVVYLDAKGLFNRHYSNLPIEKVEILGWSQNAKTWEYVDGAWVRREVPTPEFEIWYDSIEISINGWGNNPL